MNHVEDSVGKYLDLNGTHQSAAGIIRCGEHRAGTADAFATKVHPVPNSAACEGIIAVIAVTQRIVQIFVLKNIGC